MAITTCQRKGWLELGKIGQEAFKLADRLEEVEIFCHDPDVMENYLEHIIAT